MQRVGLLLAAVMLAWFGSCISIDVPTPTGPFVLSGQAQAIEDNNSCFIWLANDGTTYVLWQGPRIPNDVFDTVVTPGTTARLELEIRTDLGRPCQEGATVAQVTGVLEVNGVDRSAALAELGENLEARAEAARQEADDFRASVSADVTEAVTAFKAQVAAARETAQQDVVTFEAAVNAAVDALVAKIDAAIEQRRADFRERVDAEIEAIIQAIEDWLNSLRPRG
jgi:hypothetical protein